MSPLVVKWILESNKLIRWKGSAMIDFHTHILPGIDDGSKDIQMTEQMLAAEAAQGVEHVYATPHFYAHHTSVDQFLARREKSLEKVRALLENRPDLPGITVGAEVYYFPGMGRADHLPDLCIQGSKRILVEMPFDQWTQDVYRDIADICSRQRLHVILAHVERYIGFQKSKRVWEEVLHLPLSFQLNAGSLLSGGSKRRFCLKFLKEHENVILGSDCHNMSGREPNLKEGLAVIEKKLGTARAGQLQNFTMELLRK